jgi:ATP-dependent HslUV protease ATP-binding subunit HslU
MNKLDMTPKEIVEYLDQYIIGQNEAKKAIAIALRNRYRRMQLPLELQEEVTPKNILMIGTTGVGKTEIARRLAKIMSLPFIKVEASKFTEIGFVGRDVESMVRDLVQVSIGLVTSEYKDNSVDEIEEYIVDAITTKLMPPLPKHATEQKQEEYKASLLKMKKRVLDGKMDDRKIKITIPKKNIEINDDKMPPDMMKAQESIMAIFQYKQGNIEKEVTVKEAKSVLKTEAIENILDQESIKEEALTRAEKSGIIFIDEIDKVASSGNNRQDPSKEGVQRDLLPIIEGSSVNTRWGNIKTDHILFVSAGAFQVSKPSDLIPELQGRFPVRVELNSLTKDDLLNILLNTKNSLLIQYKAMLSVENVKLEFKKDAIEAIARLSQITNEKTEDIGARRLHTVLERVLEDISFEASENSGKKISVTKSLVHKKLDKLVEDEDVARYIL